MGPARSVYFTEMGIGAPWTAFPSASGAPGWTGLPNPALTWNALDQSIDICASLPGMALAQARGLLAPALRTGDSAEPDYPARPAEHAQSISRVLKAA
jgi:hypothetical protein